MSLLTAVRFMGRALAITATATAAACSGATPSSPTGPTALAGVDLTGRWTGTRHIEAEPINGDGECTSQVTATFTQAGATVHGFLEDVGGTCSPLRDLQEVDGEVRGPFLILTFRQRPAYTPAMARIDDGQLVVNWFDVRWTLRR